MLIVCEPLCVGFAHEKFNSAFLYGISLAYPEEKIVFFAEKNHIETVKENLNRDNKVLKNVVYKKIKLPSPPYMIKYLFNYAEEVNCKKVMFLSICTNHLYAVKLLLRNIYKDIQCGIVVHGGLEEIKCKPGFFKMIRVWPYLQWFTNALIFFKDANIKYLVLSKVIYDNLSEYVDEKLHKKFTYIDLPYIFSHKQKKEFSKGKLVFATIGHSNYKAMMKLLNILKKPLDGVENSGYEIRIIGSIPRRRLKILKNIGFVNCVSPRKKLTREQIDFYAKDVDYFIFLYGFNSYELSVSGAFFDALYYKTPIISLKNPCMQHYNGICGDIGYMCDTMEEVSNVLKKLIKTGKNGEYSRFIKNIESLQKKISIEKSFHKIRQLMESA